MKIISLHFPICIAQKLGLRRFHLRIVNSNGWGNRNKNRNEAMGTTLKSDSHSSFWLQRTFIYSSTFVLWLPHHLPSKYSFISLSFFFYWFPVIFKIFLSLLILNFCNQRGRKAPPKKPSLFFKRFPICFFLFFLIIHQCWLLYISVYSF